MPAPAVIDHGRFIRRSTLASICLCLVAGLHAWRVTALGQTPWKGGGFGMFSTVDAENARFLRVYLITEAGEIAVRIPDTLAKRQAVLRAAPSEQGARDLADKLLALRWQRRSDYWRRVGEGVLQTAGGPIDGAVLHPAAPTIVGDPPALGENSDWEPIDLPAAGGIRPNKIRIEILRHLYDEAARELKVSKILEVTRSAPEDRS